VRSSIAGSVLLAWDASPSPGVTGYRMHVGTSSRQYSRTYDTGNVLTYQVTGLETGVWYFAVTAYDDDGNTSDYSNEVYAAIQAPVTFFILSTTASVNWYGVVLQITTSENSSAILRYQRIQDGAGWTTILATEFPTKTKHRAVIYIPKGYAPNAYWRYNWIATSAKGVKAESGSTFQTR
jgi:hypothetical protein